jgi:hypothetical protein
VRESRGLGPLLVALLIGAAMVWLARGPFDAPAMESIPLATIRTLEPKGDVAAFPRRFSWQACPGADLYEISVGNEATRQMLFRQRGPLPGLDLSIAAGAEPPPGRYVWEVLAFRRDVPTGRGVGAFEVRPDSSGG